jgi:hypothetical protein
VFPPVRPDFVFRPRDFNFKCAYGWIPVSVPGAALGAPGCTACHHAKSKQTPQPKPGTGTIRNQTCGPPVSSGLGPPTRNRRSAGSLTRPGRPRVVQAPLKTHGPASCRLPVANEDGKALADVRRSPAWFINEPGPRG